MSEKIIDEKHAKQTLKEMVEQRKPDEPVEEVLTTFCQRYSLSMAACRSLYDELVKTGEIEEK